MTTHLMLDLETLGTVPGCAILSIGAAPFEAEPSINTYPYFYETIDLASCFDAGLVIDPRTIAWWMQQAEDVRGEAFSGKKTLVDTLLAFNDFYNSCGRPLIWGHGAGFDLPILEAAYRAANCYWNWGYRAGRDTRTIFDIAGIEATKPVGAHNALTDAIAQAQDVMRAMQIINGWRR